MEEQQIPEESRDDSSSSSSMYALVGIGVVVIIVIWGLVNIAGMIRPWIASFFPKKATSASSSYAMPEPVATTSLRRVVEPTTSRAVSQTKHKTSGPADLVVRISAVGVIDPATDTFVARSPSHNEMAAVSFDIANEGGASSGTWSFEAMLPTADGYRYISPPQSSLNPGGHVLNTLRFTDLAAGGGAFSVIVDPGNTVRDANRSNNYASEHIGAGYGGSYYQY